VKILLLGQDGQVGHELARQLPTLGGEIVPLGRDAIDLADLARLRDVVRSVAPRLIINTVAYNAVDQAEAEPDAAIRVNAEAVGLLGELARDLGGALIHYSTDFVFDGAKGAPYVEEDATHPLSAYGRSKRAGELALEALGAPALVLRTAWVYSLRRKSFVSMIQSLARDREEIQVVTDQVGSPTWCRDLARATVDVVRALGPDPAARAEETRGIYHAAGEGQASRFELAEAILALDPGRAEHRVRRLVPVTSDAFPTPAARPAFAPLDGSKLHRVFGVRLAPWRDALAEALRDPAGGATGPGPGT
jgi:dTDP-4-dehydrorhamnose reductase